MPGSTGSWAPRRYKLIVAAKVVLFGAIDMTAKGRRAVFLRFILDPGDRRHVPATSRGAAGFLDRLVMLAGAGHLQGARFGTDASSGL
jgi:hypothetical protein